MWLLLLACHSPEGDTGKTGDPWAEEGIYAAGSSSFSLTVPGRDVPIPARVWYPTEQAGEVPIENLVEDPTDQASYAGLLSTAPAGCPSTVAAVSIDSTPIKSAGFPLILYSHCHTCLGISGATIAAALAEHGYVVVAPDHRGNTLFDALAGDGGNLDEATLAQRAADLTAALDLALAGDLPENLPIDAQQIGVMGHSFGAVTAGRVVSTDDRVGAALMMGAPFDNPLLLGADAATVEKPTLLLELAEDHSVGTVGNQLIEANYDELAGPAWLAELPDAGHWSVSDLCGLIPDFSPGCGEDTRQEDGSPFTYLPATEGRSDAAQLATAFFSSTLLHNHAATRYLNEPHAWSIEQR